MKLLQSIDHYFSALERSFLGATILFTSLLLLVNVILRYIFNHSIYWAEELVRYLMVWVIFLGSSQVAKLEGHITVDILYRAVPQKAKTFLDYLVNVVAILFCLVLAYYSYHMTMRVYSSQQISPALEIPMWLAYLSIPLGSVLMAIRYVVHFFNRMHVTGVAID
jgi:C4-dicarboxylate transporter, DctQ subunit